MPPSWLTDPEIAAQMVTMPPTAATHVTSLLAKLEATNRRHADDIAAHQALA
jgi:DNA-binding NarL/FixJ family response regulator